MKLKIILLLLLFFELCFAQNVIIVVLDGARFSETFDADSTFIPHMYKDMKPFGTVFTNFRIAHEGKTETNPGHGSILTGTWQQIKNDGTELATRPTIFEYFRREFSADTSECFMIAGKKKLGIFSHSSFPDYGPDFGATMQCFNGSDNNVYDSLVLIMDSYHPRLIMVNLPDTDLRGHEGNWEAYLNAITHADSIIYQLWQKIQADSFYQNNTTLIVTNDHGRHDDEHGGFKNHGDDCEGCEHIMLLAIGRNVPKGLINDDLHFQIDVAKTVGNLLGFSAPQAEGKSLF